MNAPIVVLPFGPYDGVLWKFEVAANRTFDFDAGWTLLGSTAVGNTRDDTSARQKADDDKEHVAIPNEDPDFSASSKQAVKLANACNLDLIPGDVSKCHALSEPESRTALVCFPKIAECDNYVTCNVQDNEELSAKCEQTPAEPRETARDVIEKDPKTRRKATLQRESSERTGVAVSPLTRGKKRKIPLELLDKHELNVRQSFIDLLDFVQDKADETTGVESFFYSVLSWVLMIGGTVAALIFLCSYILDSTMSILDGVCRWWNCGNHCTLGVRATGILEWWRKDRKKRHDERMARIRNANTPESPQLTSAAKARGTGRI